MQRILAAESTRPQARSLVWPGRGDGHLRDGHLFRFHQSEALFSSWRDPGFTGPYVTEFGTVCLQLLFHVRVYLTVDQAVLLVNPLAGVVAAIDAMGTSSGLIHRIGRVHQILTKVEVQSCDGKRAKVSPRGVSFTTSTISTAVYLLDDGGAKTTIDTFQDLACDFVWDLFYGSAHHGHATVPECLEIVHGAVHFHGKGGDTWLINGIRVIQAASGDVFVSRQQGRREMKSSPIRGTVAISTPFIRASASAPPNPHVFVRRGTRRIHHDEQAFVVRSGTQSAGFDKDGKFTIF